MLTLEGHKNVVYAIAFNNPYGDKIVTGSFDKTAKLWDANTGKCQHTFRGHATEIVCLSFDPQSKMVATGSMDSTAKLLDVETGKEVSTLLGHTAEIVSLNFNTTGDCLITGSFDHTVKVRVLQTSIASLTQTHTNTRTQWWDVRTGRCMRTLAGRDE